MYTWLPLSSIADVAQLDKQIPEEYGPARVAKMLEDGLSEAVKAILVEHEYTDKDYRSTYYNFYSKKGLRYQRECIRLHFFDGFMSFDDSRLKLISSVDNRPQDHYYGYMVLRPTGLTTIGRTVLSPDVRKGASRNIICAKHKVNLLGYQLEVSGFPSMDQHQDIAVCAHVACWSMLRHYSEKYNIYREFLTHDITLMAHDFDPGGLLPAKGLQVSHVERVFQKADTYPLLIRKKGAGDLSFCRQLLAYVESGFPLFAAMQGKKHAVAVAGYEWKPPPVKKRARRIRHAWDEVRSLAVVDDNYLPYLSIPIKGGKLYSVSEIDAFIVALPEKVFYPAEEVDKLAPTLFKLALLQLPPMDEAIVRYFMTTGSEFRKFVRERESEFDPKLLAFIMGLPFAQYLWIVETRDSKSMGC